MNTLIDPIETRATFKKMIREIKDITETDIILEIDLEADLEADLLQKFLKKSLIF